MQKEEFTTEDWLKELREFYPADNVRRPGGITHTEYAELEGIGERQATRRLVELLKKGELTRERALCDDGLKRFVYYKV